MAAPHIARIESKISSLGEGMVIRRALPNHDLRMIGAWCFLDHAGPKDVSIGPGMRVGPHPHIGLQTFTWMIEGEVLHRDSLGYEQIIRPGQVNLMTAGRGIAHSEESPRQRSPNLHLAQLWIALPDSQRDMPPSFEHYPNLPFADIGDFRATLLVGEAFGQRSPVRVHTPLLGVDLVTQQREAEGNLALRTDFEYGVLLLEGEAEVEGHAVGAGTLLHLSPGHERIRFRSLTASGPTRLLLIGGEPFQESILLWWNFVARTEEEIARATVAWNDTPFFGDVRGYEGNALIAPPPPPRIRPSK